VTEKKKVEELEFDEAIYILPEQFTLTNREGPDTRIVVDVEVLGFTKPNQGTVRIKRISGVLLIPGDDRELVLNRARTRSYKRYFPVVYTIPV